MVEADNSSMKLTQDDLRKFQTILNGGNRDQPKVAMAFFIVRQTDAPTLRWLLTSDDPLAKATYSCIDQFLKKSGRTKKGQGALCLSCDTEFSRDEKPAAFVVHSPYMLEPANTALLLTGICHKCAKSSDEHLMDVAKNNFRGIAPDLQEVAVGQG
jgi:hypothetical protein